MDLEVCSGRKFLVSNDVKYDECFCAGFLPDLGSISCFSPFSVLCYGTLSPEGCGFQASVCWLLDGFCVLVALPAAASEAVAVPQGGNPGPGSISSSSVPSDQEW